MTSMYAAFARLRTSFLWTYLVSAVFLAGPTRAAGPNEPALRVMRSNVTGQAAFVRPARGTATIPVSATGAAPATPLDFWRQHGPLFGVLSAQSELRQTKSERDALGHTATSFQQYVGDVPVFGGVLRTHQNAAGAFVAANGDFYSTARKVGTTPTLTSTQAGEIARAETGPSDAHIAQSELTIVDPGWYGDPPQGAHLAYYVIIEKLDQMIRDAYFIDAHSGKVLDRWSLICTARNRQVYNSFDSGSLPGTRARFEGDPANGDFDVDSAYEYLADFYGFYSRAFGRDAIDNAGSTIIATTHSGIGCPNAFWDGYQVTFCTGVPTDDVVGHEGTHGVTQYTAGLIYQNQSGQMNEAFSDIFGELIDLYNGDAAFPGPASGPTWPEVHETGPTGDFPNDLRTGCGSSKRWMVGEDSSAFGGAIRDMWDPTCYGDPDRANSPLQLCQNYDNGGVHFGSGVLNHCFALLTDGQDFNGVNVRGIGPIKSGAVFYRALSVYLTPASDFADADQGFIQAAADLVGTFPNDPRTGLPSDSEFTADDALQVELAGRAVELDTNGQCGANQPAARFDPAGGVRRSHRTVERRFRGRRQRLDFLQQRPADALRLGVGRQSARPHRSRVFRRGSQHRRLRRRRRVGRALALPVRSSCCPTT